MSGADYPGHEGPVAVLAFAPDSRHLAAGGEDGTLRIWPVPRAGEE